MATSVEFVEFACEQIRGTGAVCYKKMFGEYMIYVDDKPLLLVCDDTVFVKIRPETDAIITEAGRGFPYDGAKEHYVLDIDNTELSKAVIEALLPVTPIPKPRKKKTSKQQLLRDPNFPPTSEIIAEGLGAASYKTYTKFVNELAQNHAITLMDWRFYNDVKAWLTKGEHKWTTARGTNKVKPIFWLSIWDSFFRVSFNFSASLKEELLSLSMSRDAKKIIQDTEPAGKTMRYIPVILDIESDSQLSDIYLLAEFRKIKVK